MVLPLKSSLCHAQVQAAFSDPYPDLSPLHSSNRDLSVIARSYLVNSGLDIIRSQLDTWPGSRKQDEDRQLPAGKILLVSKISVCRDQKLVAILLSRLKQRAILQFGPSSLEGGIDRVTCKIPTKGHGSALIEQNSHERTDSANAFTS